MHACLHQSIIESRSEGVTPSSSRVQFLKRILQDAWSQLLLPQLPVLWDPSHTAVRSNSAKQASEQGAKQGAKSCTEGEPKVQC